jgi:putative flippase GtrA
MADNKQKITQFLRFCAVGFVNTGVDFSAFFLLNGIGVPHLLAQVLSYSTGVANSFVLNRKWTFSIKGRTNAGEVAKFIIVNSISLLVSSSLLYIMYDINHLDLWLAKAAATVGGIAINYIGSRLWVFTQPRPNLRDAVWRLSERTR